MDRRSYLFVSAPFSGIEVFFRNLRPRFEAVGGIDTTWLFIDWAAAERSMQVPFIGSNWTVRCGVAARGGIRSFERSGRSFDAVVFNHVTLPSFVRRFRRRTPMLLSIDVTPTLLDGYSSWYKGTVQGLSPSMRRLKTALVDRPVYHDARYILAWSALTRESLIQEYGVAPERVVVVPPGINLEGWCPGEPRKAARRRGEEGLRVLFVGADFERKGGDHVLALARMPEFQGCGFDIVTKEPAADRPPNVRFHTGMTANSQPLRDLYGNADLFLLPTRADFTPNAICEAMAMELPVISTNAGGIPEMIKQGETGFLHPVDDRDAFAGSLLTLLRDAGLRKAMGEAGRRRVVESYDIVKTAAVVLGYLDRVAGA